MKTAQSISAVLCGSAILFLTGCDGDLKKVQAENEALRAELAQLKARAEVEDQSGAARASELRRLQADAQDAARLRGEITQLRNTSKEAEKLRAENQQLRTENQKLRSESATASAAPPTPAPAPGTFPRESWTFAGYTSPEAALVSAIWSMQQGNPKQYFDSLTPEEQARMSKVWEGKSAEEIAAKHQTDTSKITGMRVLNSQAVGADQVVMSVYIEGVDRAEKVSLQRVGNEWKFGGYIREPPKP